MKPARELSVDFYRVLAAVVIVLGHWLAASVTYRDGQFGSDNVLAELPWTQWLTLIFQVVPAFFLVAGYANAASWIRSRDADDKEQHGWLRRRLTRTLGPTTVYVAMVLVVIAMLSWARVDSSQLAFGSWAVALHLWFIPVYLVVVSLTPLAVAAHHRWGLAVPAVLAVAVAAVDVATLSGWLPQIGPINYLLCWAAIYQLGIAWYHGMFRGHRPILLTVGAAIVLAIVVWLGPYPVSMVGVPGEAVQNTSPPTVAMLAFAATQAGLLIMVAPTISRMLRVSPWRRPLETANSNVMMLYLWHMVPVVVVALIAYPIALLPQPTLGSGAWWLNRLGWVAILSVVTAGELMLLWLGRARVAGPLPSVRIPVSRRLAGPLTIFGGGVTAFALSSLATSGLTADGRFPAAMVLLFASGVVLVSLDAVGLRQRTPA